MVDLTNEDISKYKSVIQDISRKDPDLDHTKADDNFRVVKLAQIILRVLYELPGAKEAPRAQWLEENMNHALGSWFQFDAICEMNLLDRFNDSDMMKVVMQLDRVLQTLVTLPIAQGRTNDWIIEQAQFFIFLNPLTAESAAMGQTWFEKESQRVKIEVKYAFDHNLPDITIVHVDSHLRNMKATTKYDLKEIREAVQRGQSFESALDGAMDLWTKQLHMNQLGMKSDYFFRNHYNYHGQELSETVLLPKFVDGLNVMGLIMKALGM